MAWGQLHFVAAVVGRTTQETTQETAQEQIRALLRAEPALACKALSERIGLSTDGIKYPLEKLKKAGATRRSGSTKSGHWRCWGDGCRPVQADFSEPARRG